MISKVEDKVENKVVNEQPLILVADWDLGLVADIKHDLEQEGYEIITATEGEEALAILRKTRVDVVVLDVVMSGLLGWKVFEAIHREAIMPLQKVIFIFGIAEDGTTPRVMQLFDVPFAYWDPPTWMMQKPLPDGFDWTNIGILMVKPFTMSSLRSAITQVLKSANANGD